MAKAINNSDIVDDTSKLDHSSDMFTANVALNCDITPNYVNKSYKNMKFGNSGDGTYRATENR